MKEKFLAIIEKVKETGIADILSEITSAEELKAAWDKFKAENEQLFADCYAWADEYAKEGYEIIFDEVIFNEGMEVENPVEIVIAIYIASQIDIEISECKVFEEYADLTDALKSVGNELADNLAKFIDEDFISEITAETLFSFDDEEDEETEEDDDSDGEEAEDAEETESNDSEAEDGEEKNPDDNEADVVAEESEPDEKKED